MKNIAYTLIAIIIAYAFLMPLQNTDAAFWEDHFDQEAEKDWQHKGNDSVWTVEDGFLKTEIRAQEQWRAIFERYQFIAYPGRGNTCQIWHRTRKTFP